MATQHSGEVRAANPQVERLVNLFMDRVGNVADNEDWAESDGWVGQMIIRNPDRDSVHKYAIKDGKFHPTDSEGPFVATIRMSMDTFIDMMTAATSGDFICTFCGAKARLRKPCGRCGNLVGDDAESWAEFLFVDKHRREHISYVGERWIVDSERFRKVLRSYSCSSCDELTPASGNDLTSLKKGSLVWGPTRRPG